MNIGVGVGVGGAGKGGCHDGIGVGRALLVLGTECNIYLRYGIVWKSALSDTSATGVEDLDLKQNRTEPSNPAVVDRCRSYCCCHRLDGYLS